MLEDSVRAKNESVTLDYESRRALESLGGALAIRRAPPVLLERIPALGDAGAAGALMKGIREVFDPAGILRSSPFFPGM
jgi:hypothetical protein